MTQAELARYIGLNAQWINCLVRGREPISNDTELRLRAFVGDLANGKHPEPLAKKPSRPNFEKASDVPLPDAVRDALLSDPLTHKHFRVFIEHLMDLGITQRMLAEWWGYSSKHVNKIAYGRYGEIPHRGANRLREIFGLPAVAVDWTPPPIPKLGKIPATPEIEALFNSGEFGIAELRIVVEYLRKTYRFEVCKLSQWLGFSQCHLSNVLGGCVKSVTFKGRLRSIFAFAQNGGGE
jgi:plasmid maintenance system antidote protein VapI